MFEVKILCLGGPLHGKRVEDKGEKFSEDELVYRKKLDDQKHPSYVCETMTDQQFKDLKDEVKMFQKGYV
ncbi:hypothetical protein ACVBEE_00590 [Acinetobacter sp. ANC 3781]